MDSTKTDLIPRWTHRKNIYHIFMLSDIKIPSDLVDKLIYQTQEVLNDK